MNEEEVDDQPDEEPRHEVPHWRCPCSCDLADEVRKRLVGIGFVRQADDLPEDEQHRDDDPSDGMPVV